MRVTLAVVGTAMGLLLTGATVSISAHHAVAAEFDANKPVNFKGTVTKMEWTNPHTWLHVDVKKADGTAENWAIEPARRTCSSGAASPRNRCCRAPRS